MTSVPLRDLGSVVQSDAHAFARGWKLGMIAMLETQDHERL